MPPTNKTALRKVQKRWLIVIVLALSAAVPARADESTDVAALLAGEIIGPRQALLDTEAYLEPRIPRASLPTTVAAWQKEADRLRREVLERVVFRGEAAAWRAARTRVEVLGTISGGAGYAIKKLRYEALPGMWVPALLYEPEKPSGKMPVSLAVNGHDRNGKAAEYKQMRCINMARRGMLVLNVEWFGMGQLRGDGYGHQRLNQLDLCGASGVAPFFLAMQRGLDVLLAHPAADSTRVAVSGLSGGGWQTIFIGALDPRVTLANPVAGYSDYRTRIRHHKDLGDSEQTPCDLATVADYTHLTMLMAPRPLLLTYNAKDDCCFEAGYALPPLLQAAEPAYKLFGKEKSLRSHVNHDPGTHNFEKDNRQALYRVLGDFFFADDPKFSAIEIDAKNELKTADELAVELPAKNLDFSMLARALADKLPRVAAMPGGANEIGHWQRELRRKLAAVLRYRLLPVEAVKSRQEAKGGIKAICWKLKIGGAWSVPVVELTKGEPKGLAILLNDAGRRADPANALRLLAAGKRVLAVDLTGFGEASIAERAFLWDLMIATIGDRSLGILSAELLAVERWAAKEFAETPEVVAVGPRLSLVALIAAAMNDGTARRLELHGALGSIKEVLEQNRGQDQWPEIFCFGLLEAIDVQQLAALAAPRVVTFVKPSPRVAKEMADLRAIYRTLGSTHDPLAQ